MGRDDVSSIFLGDVDLHVQVVKMERTVAATTA